MNGKMTVLSYKRQFFLRSWRECKKHYKNANILFKKCPFN